MPQHEEHEKLEAETKKEFDSAYKYSHLTPIDLAKIYYSVWKDNILREEIDYELERRKKWGINTNRTIVNAFSKMNRISMRDKLTPEQIDRWLKEDK